MKKASVAINSPLTPRPGIKSNTLMYLLVSKNWKSSREKTLDTFEFQVTLLLLDYFPYFLG